MIYDLNKKVDELFLTPSDINEHFPAIIKYGQQCDSITEMGVRSINSTWAWLACNAKDGLHSYDLHHPSTWDGDLQSVYDTAEAYDIKFKFTEANVLNIDIEPTDLLFLDTWHVYDQLKAELARHHKQVKKYICFHDTTSFEHHGEATTSHHDFHGELTQGKGLWDAVSEFLEETNIGLPELHKDIAWTDPDTGLVWVPNTINNPDQGMVFADGTNKDEWSWAAVKSKKVEDRKEGDPEYKMDMSTKKNFKERDYMDALSFIGILPD